LNILWLQWRDIKHPWSGGAEVYMHQICKRLAQKGHKIHAITSWHPKLKHKETIDGYTIQRIGNHDNYILHIPKILKTYKNWANIIIEDTSKIPLLTPILRPNKTPPVVAIVHHLNRDIYLQELPIHKAIIAYMLETIMPKLYTTLPNTHLIAVSNSTKQELIKLGAKPQKIHIVPNAIDHNPHNPNTIEHKAPQPTILWFSRYKKYKQPHHAITAFLLASKQIPNAKLIIAGKGTETLREIAKKLKLKNIEILGEVNEKTKAELMQQAWALIYTSKKEGYGLTVLEANAHGTPAIGYNVPGLRDSIRHMETGILVPYGNIKAIAKAMIMLTEDQELWRRLAENALNWAKQFDWDKSAEKFEKILSRALLREP